MHRPLPFTLAVLAACASPPSPTDLVVIETSDIARFWTAFDQLADAPTADDSARILRESYLEPGTPGLQDFVTARIEDEHRLQRTIARFPRYYASIREPTGRVPKLGPGIRETLRRWDALVPGSAFPEVYFVIGRLTSGGTTSPSRILIGTEMYGRTPDTPTDELTDWLREVLSGVDRLPAIVAHELVHTQQDYPPDVTLLSQSIKEGVADFLSELITGDHINAHIHDWADPREAQLWTDFQQVMHGSDMAGWLYDRRAEDEPNDLGYWMGYQIAEAYYEQAADRDAAVREMLTIRDFDAFVTRSGYGQ